MVSPCGRKEVEISPSLPKNVIMRRLLGVIPVLPLHQVGIRMAVVKRLISCWWVFIVHPVLTCDNGVQKLFVTGYLVQICSTNVNTLLKLGCSEVLGYPRSTAFPKAEYGLLAPNSHQVHLKCLARLFGGLHGSELRFGQHSRRCKPILDVQSQAAV